MNEGGVAADVDEVVRRRLALVLDTDDVDEALATATRLRPWFGVAKAGYQLVYSAGPRVVPMLAELGYAVFADLKLHDIPNTTYHGARAIGRLGATYLTVHTAGGAAVLEAGVEGLAESAPDAAVLGVTVLTSEPDVPSERIAEGVNLAAAAGCGGVVCAVPDLAVVTATAPALLAVTPGIRLAGAPSDDQARVATPAVAVAGGADLLVVGRTVTAAPVPEDAAAAVAAEVAAAVAERPRDAGRNAGS